MISDVDGTITRSDVLGHMLPRVGLDWSHTGVARLFTNIQRNGYLILFLSSRAIAQVHLLACTCMCMSLKTAHAAAAALQAGGTSTSWRAASLRTAHTHDRCT